MVASRLLTRLYTTPSATLTIGGACLGPLLHKTKVCKAEPDRQRRKRPPKFGPSIPSSITKRGITISPIDIDVVNSNRDDCPMCKKFGSGPCGDVFKRWLDCTDQYPGKDSDGQPLHLKTCSEFAVKLSKCLDEHSEYYTKYDEEHKDDNSNENDELKAAWSEFVKDTEVQINSHVYKLKDFPAIIAPTIQVRLQSKTGAAFFKPQMDNDSSLVVAYIIDDCGNVLAAGSREDMDMGSQHGCVLLFDMPTGIKSAICRAIYEEGTDTVTVFSKTMLVPDGES